jgi:phosphate-selective porin
LGNYINNFDLDDELKYSANLIKLQSEKVINNSTDDNKYKGILDN